MGRVVTGISLLGAAGYLPETVRDNAYFGASATSPMFRGSARRHHVAPGETATDMIAVAAARLADQLGLDLARDVDIVLTNVPCPDQPFTGCGASVTRALGLRPHWVLDVQNTGCISFVFMLAIARALMASSRATTALLCNVQNAAGRIFDHPDNRARPQSAIPGDGCGVSYVVAGDERPVRAICTRVCGDFADDMRLTSDDGGSWWQPRTTPLRIDFTEARVGQIVSRGNRLVPDIVARACGEAGVDTGDIDVLVTNQPNHTFLRNWREALQLPEERHVHTFDDHGNLFGAAIPIAIERALHTGALSPSRTLAIGGFSHAGDYAGAAVVDWR